MEIDDKYLVHGVNLSNIRNRNESRVAKVLNEVLDDFYDEDPDVIDIQDIFALALNKLPARYVQQGGMVLKEPLREADIRDAVEEAIQIVKSKPNY